MLVFDIPQCQGIAAKAQQLFGSVQIVFLHSLAALEDDVSMLLGKLEDLSR